MASSSFFIGSPDPTLAVAPRSSESLARASRACQAARREGQIRIFYLFRPGRRIVLLDGIIKKQDKIPRDVLKRVRRYMQEVEIAEEDGS